MLLRAGLSSSSTKAFHSRVLVLPRSQLEQGRKSGEGCRARPPAPRYHCNPHLVLHSLSWPGRCSMKEPLPSQ